jgi:hypothetical protein
MSLYEVLVIVALAAAGGYAWHLYRSDVRSPRTGETKAEGELMFGRAPRTRAGDGKASDDPRK